MDAAPPLPDRLLHEQVRLLARNVPALVVGTVALAFGTAGLLWMNGHPMRTVGAWLSAMLLLCAWRVLMARRFAREAPAWDAAPAWARRFVLASALAGFLWGSLALLFSSPTDIYSQALVVMVLAGIVSSATQSLAPYFRAHMAFGVLALVPFAVQCLLSGDARAITLGLLALVFLVMAELFARRIAAAIEESLRLRFENEGLVNELSMEKERAELASLAKTRFLATASHDLRQPIHAMSLFVPALKTLAQQSRITPPVLENIADRMQGALENMSRLLNRLLDVSRLDAGAVEVVLQPVALHPILQTVVDEVSRQAKAKELRLRLRRTRLWVHSDPAILYAIMSNLVGNAVRYTERGGVLLGVRSRGQHVDLQIWDTGIGIAADEVPRITEEFYQARNAHQDASQSRGFGLGMAIVQRSAILIGAPVSVRSRLGRGSVFSIRLPAAQALADTLPTTQDAEAPAAQRRVLVVDDDVAIRVAMRFLLKGWGHDPVLAASMDEALQCARQGDPIDAALVDYQLAPQATGLEVAAALQAQLGRRIPILIVTGDTSPEVIQAVEAKGLRLVHKPVDPEVLRHFVNTLPHRGH